VVVAISPADVTLARRIADTIGGHTAGLAGRVEGADILFADAGSFLREQFRARRPIAAIMAAGALIRLLAAEISDKTSEPPVLAVSLNGLSVVPLLGGHRGANDLARRIAELTGGHAAITTAGDVRFGVALDDPPAGWRLANGADAKPVMARLLAGATARLEGEAPWLAQSQLPVADDGAVALVATDEARKGDAATLVYHPATLVLGIGCERGADPAEAVVLAQTTLAEGGWSPLALAAVASIDLKTDEPAVHAVAAHFGVPARFFAAAELEALTPRLANPSEAVFAETGCHGVAEGAALACAGEASLLVAPKRKSRRCTAAMARATRPLVQLAGMPRGRLSIVGIGPGAECWRSPEATVAVERASDLVGYSLYLDLLGPIGKKARRHDFPLGAEEARVRRALELAGEGREVALVSSGDAGIYAMASLAFELIERGKISAAARRSGICVMPGISAMQAAAARIGAPLGHDFCAISLSDLLTPVADIRRRIAAAAAGDFVVAFYNPVSARRRTLLAEARDVLLAHRPAATPVVLAANLGREGEALRVVSLGELRVEDVDMLTVVIVGSSQTRSFVTGDGRTFVYTPRGYGAKAGKVAP
jgi:cobalt-precorrin 5A hydrolase/precorrin-3B C17-methyltransferase